MTDTVSGVFTELKASHNVITSNTTASAITQGTSAVVALDSAITAVNTQRATYGAAVNQLTYAVDNLSNVKVNAEASRSRVMDADYAVETSELARTQIISAGWNGNAGSSKSATADGSVFTAVSLAPA